MVLFNKFRSHPFKHVSLVRQDFSTRLNALVKGFKLNVGKLVEQSILDYPENNFSRNIPHPALITLFCNKGGVTFSMTEERCLRSSPLTLTRVLKTPTQGEEVERARKKKKVASKLLREAASIADEEREIEEKGVGGEVEDYSKKLVLSPRAE